MHLRKRLCAILVLVVLTAATFLVSTLELYQDDEGILPLFEKKKESIYFWYDDENMSDYINSAAVNFGELNNVRVFPQLVSESQYLEAINYATLYEEHMPDAFLISNDSLEKAYLAGLAVGYWADKDEVRKNWAIDRIFEPEIDDAKRKEMVDGWDKAVKRSYGWA